MSQKTGKSKSGLKVDEAERARRRFYLFLYRPEENFSVFEFALEARKMAGYYGEGSDTFLLFEGILEKLVRAAIKNILDNQLFWLMATNLVYAVDNVISIRRNAVRTVTSK